MSDTNAGPTSDTREPRPRGFGSALREARERSDLTAADVANALKLSERMILTLEAERYEDLPARPYVRGYVRRYARVVGLNGEALTAGFDAADEAEATPPIMPTPRRSSLAEFAGQRWGLLYGSIVFVFIAVIAGALWWAWSGENAKEAMAEVAATEVNEGASNAEEEPALATPGDPADAESLAEQAATVPTESAPAAAPPPLLAGAPGSGAPVTTVPEQEDPATAAPVVATETPLQEGEVDGTAEQPATEEGGQPEMPDLLTFSFLDECWVEVRGKGGNLIHGDLGRKGEMLTLTGEAPFSILVGYAAGVEITLNGDRVALEPGTRSEVARLVVGH